MTALTNLMMYLMFFIMVAEVSSADSSTSTTKEFNVGRAFAHCVKLTGANYQIWITGIISTIVGISGVSQLENVRQILEYFESNGHKAIEKIDEELSALISNGKSRLVTGSLKDASNLLYTILNVTIDSEKLSHLVLRQVYFKKLGSVQWSVDQDQLIKLIKLMSSLFWMNSKNV